MSGIKQLLAAGLVATASAANLRSGEAASSTALRSEIDALAQKYNCADGEKGLEAIIDEITINYISSVETVLDGIEREEMEEYVSKNGLSSNVIFPGYMTMQEMVAFLSAADIYVSSSKADAGLAASTAEAMSIGLPIIVSNNSENSFWVENSGLLFDDGDSKGIANAILQIANDKELSSNFGANGRARILRDNDYKTEMSKVNSLYLNICSKVE